MYNNLAFNNLLLQGNDRHFAGDSFNSIFLNENIVVQISPKFD